jgi:cytochrome c
VKAGLVKNTVKKGIPVIIFAVLLMASAPGPSGRTVWDRVYTVVQAGRGLQVYTDHCSLCHAVSMQGGPGSPALIGPEFRFLWADKPVGALYEIMRAKMPPGQAGALSDQEYADILAAILQRNGFPAGADTELPSDSAITSNILITWDKP